MGNECVQPTERGLGGFKIVQCGENICVNGKVIEPLDMDCDRLIYRFEEFIIKVDSGTKPESQQGRREIAFLCNILEEKDSKYFHKILCSGEFESGDYWIFQRFLKLRKPKCKSKIVEHLIEKYGLIDVEFEPESKTAYNWGIKGNHAIIYDYASWKVPRGFSYGW